LGISLSTVKNVWRSIYSRSAAQPPVLFPKDAGWSKRGKERRRRLLAYLREHPEELRPVSLKIRQRAAGPVRSSQYVKA
jgi:hypothetical protein